MKRQRRMNKSDILKAKHRVINNVEFLWGVTTQENDIHQLLQIPPEKRIAPDHYVTIANRMTVRGSYMAAEGTYYALEDNVAKGWYLMRQSVIYQSLKHYTCFPVWNTVRDKKWRPSEWHYRIGYVGLDAWLACMNFVLSPQEGKWFLDQMICGLIDGRYLWTGDDFFGAYLVRLYKMLQGSEESIHPPNPRKNWVHPYDNIFANWNNAGGLAAAIYDMCEYHMHANNRDWDNHYGEFRVLIAALNPIEVHVLEYVRHQLGLPTPKVEHELLQPPFYPIPDFAKNITTEQIIAEDPLLHDVVQFLNDWVEYPLK